MKKFVYLISGLFLSLYLLLGLQPPVRAASVNLISNPSFETASGGQPTDWNQGGWGSNTRSFDYSSTNPHSGSMSATVNITNYSTGDAKWLANPVSVSPSTKYTYSDYYRSDVSTRVVAAFVDNSGNSTYVELSPAAPATNWMQYTTDFTTPSNVATVTVYHLIDSNGSLTIDDVRLALFVTPPTTTQNLIANPSMETSTDGVTPDSWNQGGWGTNTSNFSYQNTGHTGTRSLYVQMSNYSSGDAKWYANAVAVNAGQAYTYSDYYQSSTSTELVAQYLDASGQATYVDLGSVPASQTWAQASVDLTIPANITKVSIFHLIAANGWLSIDDVSLMVKVPTSNLISNPSVESASNNQPTGWQHDKWGTNTSTFSYITNDGHNSTKSVKVTISKYSSGDAKWYFNPISSVSGDKSYKFSAWYKTNTQPSAVVMYTDSSNNENYMTIPRPLPNSNSSTTWTQYSSTFTLPKGATSATVFMLISSNGWLQVDDYSMQEYTPTGFSQPIVSLTFDDGLASTYTNGLPLLEQYGVVSTQYLISGFLNTPGYMTTAQASAFKAQGSEIGSHTVTHPALTTLTSSALNTELSQSQSTLRGLFGSDTAIDFASPEGLYNQSVLTAVKQYYRSHRSVDVGYNSKDNFDPYNIRVQNIEATTTPAEVADWVNQAINTNSWLVIVYHGIDNGTDPYHTTPSDLSAELSNIRSTGVQVMTVGQALDTVLPQL